MSRRGYDVKPITTFVGNHYLFSERQCLALARSVSAKEYIQKRVNKELLHISEAVSEPYPNRWTHHVLISDINEIGFLPFFKNEIEGFSVEEHTSNLYWWTGNKEQDSWEWRELIARSGEVAYGKFFHKKAGFISKKWFPYFAYYRRDGYDMVT